MFIIDKAAAIDKSLQKEYYLKSWAKRYWFWFNPRANDCRDGVKSKLVYVMLATKDLPRAQARREKLKRGKEFCIRVCEG